MKLLLSLLLLFLITSFEMGTFNVFFGSQVHNSIIVLCAGIVAFFWLARLSKNGLIQNFGLFEATEFRYFLFFSAVSAVYFIVHAFIVGPSTGVKYSAYLFLFFVLISQIKRNDFDKLVFIYLCLMALLAAMSVLQVILVAISGLSADQFDSIKHIEDKFFQDIDYVMPFLLGYMSVEEGVTFGPLNFVRSIGFSSEPKYFSVLLWVALAVCLGWTSVRSRKVLFLMKMLLVLGLFFSHAYSSLLVIVFALAFSLFLRITPFGDKINALLIITTPLILITVVSGVMEVLLSIVYSDFVASRVSSFLHSTSSMDVSSISQFKLMGENVGEESSQIVTVTVLQNWFRLGHLGVAMYYPLILFVVYKSISNYKYLKSNRKLSFVLLLAIYVVYYQIFFGQPYTLLSIFILVILYNRSKSTVRFMRENSPGISS